MALNPIPAVIFGDHIAAFGAIRGLRIHDIPIFVVSRTGTGLATRSRFVKGVFVLDPKDPCFSAKLNKMIKDHVGEQAVLIVAGEDDYLDVLSQQRSRLSPGFRCTFPDWDIVCLVRHKRETYAIAERIGVPIPKTHYVTNEADLHRVLSSLNISFPVLMKSEASKKLLRNHGTKGVIAHSREDIIKFYKKYDGFYGQLLLQEMIEGDENCLYNFIGVFNQRSQCIAAFMNRKRRSSKQFSSCTLMESMWSEQVLEYSLRLVQEIGYIGYANVEFKYDSRDGKLKLMEINGRMTLSNSHALRCGINTPWLMYKEAVEGPLPAEKDLRQSYPNDYLWWEPLGDTLSAARLLLKGKLSLGGYIKSIKGSGYIIEPVDRRDPLPGLYLVRDYFFGLLRKLRSSG